MKRTQSFSNRPATYNKLTYLQKVSVVNRNLRLGDIANVAETTGYSNRHVSDILSGKKLNMRILNEAYDVARGRISNVKKLQKLA